LFNIHLGDLILWFVVFLISLSFHEAAHAWTSDKFGDYTGRYQGRITLNPIAHIDPLGTILIPLMSFLGPNMPMFGWAKPVDVNPLLWRDRKKASILVSAAGPASNLVLAAIAFVIIKLLLVGGVLYPSPNGFINLVAPMPGQPTLMEPIAKMLSVMLTLNIGLGIFNLIPIPPLDGSHVLEALLPPERAEAYAQIRPFGPIILIALLWLGVLGFIFIPVYRLVLTLLFS
jgi:Zn-dependent protease